jgi:predicted nucleic acid-binding protein
VAGRLILDSGGLSSLAAGERRAIAWVYRATQSQMLLGIPAPVLAETLTGQKRDAPVHRVIRAHHTVLDTTESIATMAGGLSYRAARPEMTIDAIVVATAAKFPHSIVLTSDPDDLTLLASYCPEAGLAKRSVKSRPGKE